MKKITLVERNGRNEKYVYIEYFNSDMNKTCWTDFTIGSRKSEDKLYGPKAKLYQDALDFAGVEDFSAIPYGASYTEPQKGGSPEPQTRWELWDEEARSAFDPEAHMKNDAMVEVNEDGKPVNIKRDLDAAGYYQGPGFLSKN